MTPHLDIITALMHREIAVRFGEERLSYLWAFIVPLSWIGFGILAFAAFDRQIPISTHPALFLATGILPYVIFRQTLTYVTRSVVAARRILDLPNVRFFHLIIAFAILEALTAAVICAIVLLGLIWVFDAASLANLPGLIMVFCLTWSIGVAISVFTSRLALRVSAVTRVLPLLLRPFFWISGVFFVATEIPPDWIWVLNINPLFSLIDGAREAAFQTYNSPVYAPGSTLTFLFVIVVTICVASMIKHQSRGLAG